MTKPKCHSLDISTNLKCMPEMIDLCEQEDGVRCNGNGEAAPETPRCLCCSKPAGGLGLHTFKLISNYQITEAKAEPANSLETP